ncbi:MAG: PucR family transcriptional regulator [Nocardioidaceae bacterium]
MRRDVRRSSGVDVNDGAASVSGSSAPHDDRALIRTLSGADSPRELLCRLTERLDGWGILLDPAGSVEMAEPEGAVQHLPVVRMEYDKVARQRHGSSTWIDDRFRAVLRPVVTGATVHGYLAVGADLRMAPAEVEGAVEVVGNLLAFQIDKASAVRRAERSFRSAVVQLLLTGLHREATLAARRADVALPAAPMRVAVVSHVEGRSFTPVDRVIDVVDRDLPLAVANAICGEDDHGDLTIVLSAVEGDVMALTQLAINVNGVRVALSEPVDAAELPQAAREAARLAHSISADSPMVTTRSSAYGSGLLAHIDGPAVRAFVDALLAPIVEAGEQGSIDLLKTLQVFLECDGRWNEAADRLGIHRHTLRYRIKKLEDLLGRRLHDTGTRAELWIALKLSDIKPPDAV